MTISKVSKLVLSSPLLIIKSFKKWRIDNFLGGLLIGAFFSLIVNIATVQIQEKTNKQRYFEALESEISSNTVMQDFFNNTAKTFLDKKEYIPAMLFNSTLSDKVWEAGITNGYIFSLNQKQQQSLVNYYEFYVHIMKYDSDRIKEKLNDLFEIYETCNYNLKRFNTCENDWNKYTYLSNYYANLRIKDSNDFFIESKKVLTDFHPQQDRQNSIVMKFLLGDNVRFEHNSNTK